MGRPAGVIAVGRLRLGMPAFEAGLTLRSNLVIDGTVSPLIAPDSVVPIGAPAMGVVG